MRCVGFSAAIIGKKEGLKTVLIEKGKLFGGASALSNGSVGGGLQLL
ncbi:FAD-binding protein [Sporosarcina sp. USHLN248]